MSVGVPDRAAREVATDITHSVIVQAPAGSGKTTLLVERYLKLLARVEKPEEILAITFTRKAASEMHGRILAALHQAAAAPDSPSPAHAALVRSDAMGWHLLDQPGRLKIQTIDSFAMSLIRGLPLGSGYDPSRALTEAAEPLYEAAARRLLLRLYQAGPLGDEIADFLDQCGNDAARAERLLAAMLSRRDQWLEVVSQVVATWQQAPDQVAGILSRGIHTLNGRIIDRFRTLIGESTSEALARLADHAAGERGLDIHTPAARYRLIAEMLTTTRGEFRQQVSKRDGFSTSFPEQKAELLAIIDALSRRGLAEQVDNLRYLPDPDLDEGTVRHLVNVCINLALANAELAGAFDDARTNDFTDLILSAQAALGRPESPSELALALDYRIHHILVDEFQDTSVSQFRLFERLLAGWAPGDGNSFFAVGDPMQSIYRFRDAEVGLFFEAWENGIAGVPLEPVLLTSNFRADARLVHFTNTAFAEVMGGKQNPSLGQIAYRAVTPTREAAEGSPAARISLHETQASQVEEVARRVATLLEDTEDTEDTVAILVRSRSHLRALIGTLRRRGITWHANDIDPLTDRPAVRDLISLTGALLDPCDRLSWYSLLRSPLVGLTLVDLERLPEVESFPLLLGALRDCPLSDSGRARMERLAAAWSAARWLDERPTRSVIEAIWLRLGGTDAYPDPAALMHATRLLELVDELDPGSLSAAALTRSATRLFAEDVTASRLQILTVHKSKGLEFDHVLVPFLDRAAPVEEAELLLWRALPKGLVMGVRGDGGSFAWLARENRFRERHERQRLLYVACTRAKRSLWLFATGKERPAPASLLFLLQPLIDSADGAGGSMAIERPLGAPVPDQGDLFREPEQARIPELVRLREGYRWEPPERPPLALAPDLPARPPAETLDQRLEVVVGLMIHSILERLAGRPPRDVDGFVARERSTWERLAATYELDAPNLETVVDQVAAQLTRTLQDPTGRWLLAAHPEGHAELAVTGVLDGRLENVVIDRTFVADGARWIVDYKTSVPRPGEALEGFVLEQLTRHRTQLERYGILTREMFGADPRLAIYLTAIARLEVLSR